jgi:cobalt-zinc-cadmium efflux system membrane fusion protein
MGCPDRSGHANAGEPTRDMATLDPSSPTMKFVKIEEVKPSDGAPNVALTGRVTFDEDHTQRVATPIDGRAVRLLVKPGDSVKANQSLIALSSPQVGQVQADAQKAQHDLQLAQKTADRAHLMRKDNAISDHDLEQADTDLQKAKADVGRTSSQLRALGVSATDPTPAVEIRAQIGGTIVERNVLVGQEVRADATTPLLTISNLDVLWVVADVYEQDLGLVRTGAAVNVHVPAYPGEAFPGTVAYLGDVLDPQSRTVKLRCVVPNPNSKLKPEMFAKIELTEAAGHDVLVIPSKAVLEDGGKARVIVVNAGNKLELRKVEVGPEVDRKVRVLDGLRAGEKIVTDGALFLKRDLDDR